MHGGDALAHNVGDAGKRGSHRRIHAELVFVPDETDEGACFK